MSAATVAERITALVDATRLLGRFASADVLDSVDELDRRAQQRTRVGLDRTVVALAGPTGSGKSSLFNALAGLELAEAGLRRPTTAEPLACVWGDDSATDLLDWLAIPNRRRVEHRSSLDDGPASLDGLVLLDLPDHDSMVREHRAEVDRLVGVVDVLVWVTDPVKYADALLHEEYLSRLSRHGAVVEVVLNQTDWLSAPECQACLTDLRRLLARDGLAQVSVFVTSAVDGTGASGLRQRIGHAVEARRASTDRLGADAAVIADLLRGQSGLRVRPGHRGAVEQHPGLLASTPDELAAEVHGLLPLDEVAAAVTERHRTAAELELAWPWERAAAEETAAPALAIPDTVGTVLRGYVEHSVAMLPPTWRDDVRDQMHPVTSGLVEDWGHDVRRAVDTTPRPRNSWQRLIRGQRAVLAGAAVAVMVAALAVVLTLTGSGFAVPAWAVSVLAAVGAGVGSLAIGKRRSAELDEYAASAAVDAVARLRSATERDVCERVDLPLRAQHRDHDAAVAALDLAES